ncbi:hypothetical protein P167DRAFT_490368 [Morchella conica CCBAS932]|uniref:H-type lectin domain-containing protein n=1 Tax=Morchella conica CCBAS932 TaxID=1392247 RepID=A0A3N4KMY4_9PEZI|nr:hypothetical protein P167DRAFT_490368 [Morchella conica CCBAS932]
MGAPAVERPYNKIKIPHNHGQPPQIALGISALNVQNQRDIRLGVKARDINAASFVIDTNALGGTLLYSATPTWFDNRNGQSEFQVGIFKTKQNGQSSQNITFDQPFDSTPEIVVWLNKFYITSNERMTVKAHASNLGPGGFTINYSVPDGSTLHSGAASWIAYPSTRPNTASGSFPVRPLEGQGQLPEQMAREEPLPPAFPQERQVLVGVNELEFDNGQPMRFKAFASEGEEGGLRLNFHTFGGSVCYRAQVAYLALG